MLEAGGSKLFVFLDQRMDLFKVFSDEAGHDLILIFMDLFAIEVLVLGN